MSKNQLNFALFSIVVVLSVLFILLAPRCATAQSRSEQQCAKVGAAVAHVCSTVTAPSLKSSDQGEAQFAKATCGASNEVAKVICADDARFGKYEAMPGCDGVESLTAISVYVGGRAVADRLSTQKREKYVSLAGQWAHAAADAVGQSCSKVLEMENEKAQQKERAKPVPGTIETQATGRPSVG